MHAPTSKKAGETFSLADLCFFDFESLGREPISAGTDRYARNADALMLAYAIADGAVEVWEIDHEDHWPTRLRWANAPHALQDFYERALRGEAVFVAHNATFDRNIWNHATGGFPRLEPWMVIDSRAQAAASGLPAALKDACRFVGTDVQKDKRGQDLINLFCLPTSTATPFSHRGEWIEFTHYASDDVAAMRGLFCRTRQLSMQEWREYWAMEETNEIGVRVDLPMVKAAAKMAAEDARFTAYVLTQLTAGAVTTVNQVQAMTAWLKSVLPADGRALLVQSDEEIDIETGEIVKPEKTALRRSTVIRLIAYLQSLGTLEAPLSAALELLQIRLYGGSKTPAKYSRMLQQHCDGIIRNQYVFNGAMQTGRASSRGVQIHNLARDTLPYELDAIDALVGGANLREFAKVGDDTPISRKLSLLIRPTLIASPGHVFVWGDWSNIEARLVPWLADDPEANERLEIFRAVDQGIEPYDIYTRTASELSGVPLEKVDKPVRQQGKVVELACGFGGATNALLNMAASYNIHLEETIAKEFVALWRRNNPWAPRFWGKWDGVGSNDTYGLWGAINTALERPREVIHVGRVSYVYIDSYLDGTLLCKLPSGRRLAYRRIKYEMVDKEDEDGNVIGQERELRFSRDMGRVKFWPGLACENIVQATAADILRATLVRLSERFTDPVVLHTHDEVVLEVPEASAERVAAALREVMEEGFDWSEGLPIAAETEIARFYTKEKNSMGL